jgi:hypothetical protein
MTKEVRVKPMDAVRIDGEVWSIESHTYWDDTTDGHVPTGKHYLRYLEGDAYLSLDIPILEAMINLIKERDTK